MKNLFLFLVFIIFFSTSTFAKTGKGTLKLSQETMETVIMYMYGAGNTKYSGDGKRKNNPLIMAVSEDGRSYFYTYCPAIYHDGCVPPSVGRVIKGCEKFSNGSPCYIFARKRSIDWKNGNSKVRIKKKDLKDPYLVAKKIQDGGFYDGDLSNLAGIDYKTGQIKEDKNITNKETKVTKKNDVSSDLAQELKIITDLYEDGSLTKEEFDKAKSKLLGN